VAWVVQILTIKRMNERIRRANGRLPKAKPDFTSIDDSPSIQNWKQENMFSLLVDTLLVYSPQGGSWTRNLMPDSWLNGSGGNSEYTGPGTAGDVRKTPNKPFDSSL
jgi:hypothetical protein